MAPGLLFVTQAYDPSDANLGFTCAWVEAFARKWPHVHVVCWKATKSSHANIQVHVISERGIHRLVKLILLSWQLRKEVGSVFVHMIPSVLAALGWWWRLIGWRVGLWYTHGTVSLSLRLALIWTHVAFTASKESLKLDSPKIRIVGHGIDLTQFTQNNSVKRTSTVLFVGRITPRKDLERFLRIVNKIRGQVPTLRAVIVGAPRLDADELYAKRMREYVRKEGMDNVVTWAGNVLGDDVVRLYQSAAVLLSTSKTGSIDKVVLEALACGTPVVTSGEVYRELPGVLVSSEDDALGDHVLAALREMRSIDVKEYLQKQASLPLLVERVKKEMNPGGM